MILKLPGPKKSRTASGKSAAGKILQSASAKSEASQKGQTLSGQLKTLPFTLGWSHYVFLLGVKNPDERSFYEIEATSGNWTVRELKRQFDASTWALGVSPSALLLTARLC